jgi:TonB dependent receptor/TonB-dependent Receptor Plug Domain/CarboxypepD_reg-like domain
MKNINTPLFKSLCKFFLIVVVFIKTMGFSMAQDTTLFVLKGYVKDELDNPIPNAKIEIDYSLYQFLCDDKGYFVVKLQPKTYAFTIKSVGFLTDNFATTVFSDTTLTIVMKQIVNQLEQVIITGDRGTDNVRKPIGIAQLNTRILKKIPAALGETDLLRGLQMLPGVSTVGEASNGINVRGGATDQNLMLLDETPIFNPTHMFGLFSVFPPDGVSKAELYKGNVPSRFGGRASAVLDVSLENPALDSFRLEMGIGLVSSRLLMDIPVVKDKLGFIVTGRAAFTDFLLPIVSKKLDNIKANFYDGSFKGVYRANSKNSFFLSAYVSNDFFQTNLLGTIANINASSTQNAYSTLNFSLRHFHSFNSKMSLSSSVVYVDYEPTLLLPEKGIDNTVRLESGIFYRQFRSNIDYQTKAHQIKAGITSAYYKLNPGELIPDKSISINPQKTNLEYGLESALFVEDNFNISSNIVASAGLRYSYFVSFGPTEQRLYDPNLPISQASVIGVQSYKKNEVIKGYGGFEPRFALRFDVNKSTSLKLAYNLMRQYIQTVTNTTTPLPTSRWKTADANIRPQVSNAFSAGLFKNFNDNIFELSLEAYYRHTDDIIDFKPGANLLLQQYPETELLIGQNRAYGIESMISKKKGDWTGWLSYTFSRTLNQVANANFPVNQINDGKWFPANYDRPHTINAFASLGYNKFHTFSFTFTYSTGRPLSRPFGTFEFQGQKYPYYPERNNDRMPAYHRLDFSWNIQTTLIDTKRWKNFWTFSVYNLYGRANPYSIYFNNNTGNLKSFALNIFAAPIVSLSYNAKFM